MIENVQQLLTEQLGKNGSTDATGESALQTTLPAGTTLFMNITAITLTSGIGIGYHEGPTT